MRCLAGLNRDKDRAFMKLFHPNATGGAIAPPQTWPVFPIEPWTGGFLGADEELPVRDKNASVHACFGAALNNYVH